VHLLVAEIAALLDILTRYQQCDLYCRYGENAEEIEEMLERFKVQKEDEVRVAHDALNETVSSILEKMGTSAEDAALGAEVLVATDLRGVETHGVSNMLRSYVEGYTQGTLNARPDMRIVRETPSTANIDAR